MGKNIFKKQKNLKKKFSLDEIREIIKNLRKIKIGKTKKEKKEIENQISLLLEEKRKIKI